MVLALGVGLRKSGRLGRIGVIGFLVAAFLVLGAPGNAAASVKNASVALSKDRTGAITQYTIGFYVSGSGALTGGRDEVTIHFPEGTGIPADLEDELAKDCILVNGYSVDIRDVYVSGNRLMITLPTGASVRDYGYVGVIIGEAAGIELPRKAGTYYLEIETTRDSKGSTNSFGVDGSCITSLDLTVSPGTVEEYADYEISFRTSTQGALTPEEDYIYLEFPAEVSLPRSIAGKDVRVNGVEAATDGVKVDAKTRTVRIAVPRKVNIGNRNTVEVTIDSEAGIRNPRKAGRYTVMVYTSADSEGEDESFAVGLTISAPVVSISPSDTALKSQYSIGFMTSANGALEAGKDKITFYFPDDTVIPSSISTSYVTVNGTKAKAVECVRNKGTITVTVPVGVSIDDDTYVSVVFNADAGIKNPGEAGKYRLEVTTTADGSKVKSKDYLVTGNDSASSGKDADDDADQDNQNEFKAELTHQRLGEAVSFLFTYKNGIFGDLKRGDKLYLIFAADFALPSAVAMDAVLVNGLKADKVERSGQAIVVTIPGGVDLVDTKKTVVTVLQDAGIKNPEKAGTYSLFAYSSVKPSLIEDCKVTIGGGSGSGIDTGAGTGSGNTGTNTGKIIFKIGNSTAYFGNQTVVLDSPPTIVQNFSVVPLRALGDALGAKTDYEGTTRTVTVTYGSKILVFYIDSKLVKIGDTWKTADIPATLINNRVMIPVRFVSESFGAVVNWNDETREVVIER